MNQQEKYSNKMIGLTYIVGWLAVLNLYDVNEAVAEQNPVTFTFKEYQYKDSPKNVCA